MGCNSSKGNPKAPQSPLNSAPMTPSSLQSPASSQLATNTSTAAAAGSALVAGNSGAVAASSLNGQGATSTTGTTSRVRVTYERIFGERNNSDAGQPSYASMFTEGAKGALAVLMAFSTSIPIVGIAATAVVLCIESMEAFYENKGFIEDIARHISHCVELMARFSTFVQKLPPQNAYELESSLKELSQAINALTEALNSIKGQLVLQVLLSKSVAASLEGLLCKIEDQREIFNFQLHEVEFNVMIQHRQSHHTMELHNLLAKFGAIESSFVKHINAHLENFVPGTRVWMRAEVTAWMEIKGSQLFWIQAEAGMGKSVFAASLVRELDLQGRLAASFFCKYGDSTRSKEESMVLSLAYQIAIRFPECTEPILEALRKFDLSSGESIANKMDYLLFNPINGMQEPQFPVVIVVDALDEIGIQLSKERVSMLYTLVTCMRRLKWVKFLVTARPDDDITDSFAPFQPDLLILKDDKRHMDDLRRYVAAQMKKMNISVIPDARTDDAAIISTPAQDQQSVDELMTSAVDFIVERSEGRFIYVALVAKDVFKVDCNYTKEQLKSVLPKGLNEVYLASFQRMRNDSGVRRYNKIIRPLLAILLVAREPFKVDDMKFLLNCSDSEMSDLIHLVRSMFPVVGDETIGKQFSVFHKSVADWLVNKKESRRTAGSDVTLYWLQELLQDTDVSVLKNYLSTLQKEHLSCFENLAFVCRNGAACNPLPPLPVYVGFRIYDYIVQKKLVSDWSGEDEIKYDFYVDRSDSHVEISNCMLRFVGLEPPLGHHTALHEPLSLQPHSIPTSCSYLLKHMIHHLVDAGFKETAQTLLMQLPWLLACLKHRERGVYDILADMRYALLVQDDSKISVEAGGLTEARDASFELVFQAITLSASTNTKANSDDQLSLLFVLHLIGRLRSIATKTSSRMAHLVNACEQWLKDKHDTFPSKYELPSPGGIVLHTLQVEDFIKRKIVCLTKDGRTLVALSGRGAVTVWNLSTGETIPLPKELTSTVTFICIIDSNDRTIVAAAVDNAIKFWDIHNSQKGFLQTFTAHHCQEIVSLCSVCIGSESYVISLAADYEIKMWSCVPFKFVKKFQPRDLHLSEDEKRGRIPPRLYTSNEGRYFVSTLYEFDPYYSSNLRIDNPESDAYKLWDAEEGRLVSTVHFSRVGGLGWPFTLIKDGSILVRGTRGGEIEVWDLKQKSCLLTFQGHKGDMQSVLTTPDGRQLLSQDWSGIVKLWDTTKWDAQIDPIECIRCIERFNGCSVFMSNELVVLALQRMDGAINVYDFSSATDTHVKEIETSEIATVACISPDERFVVSGWMGTLKVWDAKSGECICKHTVEGALPTLSLAVSTDCRRIMLVPFDGSIMIFNYASDSLHLFAQCDRSVTKHFGATSRELMSQATGARIVFASGDNIMVWCAEAPNKTEVLKSSSQSDIKSFESMCLSEDGRRVVIGSKVVQVWDTDTRKCIQALGDDGDKNDGIAFVGISSDCRRIAAMTVHALVTVWDSSNGLDEYSRTYTCEFGPNGCYNLRYFSFAMSSDAKRIAVRWGGVLQGGYTLWEIGSPITVGPTLHSPFLGHELKIKLEELSTESSSLLAFLQLYGEAGNYAEHLSNRTLVILDRECARLQIFRHCMKDQPSDM